MEPVRAQVPPVVAGYDSSATAERPEEQPVQSSFSPLNDDIPAWHDMITRLPGDWARFGKETFQLEKIPAIAGLAGLTAALILSDHGSWQATDQFSNRTRTSKEITHTFAEFGDGKTVVALAGGFAVVGWASDNHRALRTASQLIESYLACGITVQVFKHITGRERPERQSKPRGKWRPLPNQLEYHQAVPKFDAFPSGHTATAMAMVTVLIENYPEQKWLRPVGYLAVGLTGFGLVSKGWHWYSDFPLAIALGYQFGNIAAHHDRRNVANGSTSNVPQVTVAPAIGVNGTGISVAVVF